MSNEKILIIDDEEDMLDSCSRILKGNQYKCITSSNPVEALDIAKTELPDLIITDLKMPGMDGLEILKELKRIK